MLIINVCFFFSKTIAYVSQTELPFTMIPLALQTVKQVRFVIALDNSVVNAFEVLPCIMGQKTWSEHSCYLDFIIYIFFSACQQYPVASQKKCVGVFTSYDLCQPVCYYQ